MTEDKERFKELISFQIKNSRGKNLFYSGSGEDFTFLPEIVNKIGRINNIHHETEMDLAGYACREAIQEFCRINQYYSFSQEAEIELKLIYLSLFRKIREGKEPARTISKSHFENLVNWLRKYNAFAEKLYTYESEKIGSVACSQYSPEFQMEILKLELNNFMEPILDIGCGKDAILVKYLRNKGLEAYGIDRFAEDSPGITKSDWLDFNYGSGKWGTIISNLGFTNHFRHHHFREDGDFTNYATKYMNILHSLKADGSFHYTPDLPFIEQFLDKDQFQVIKHIVGKTDYHAVIINRQ